MFSHLCVSAVPRHPVMRIPGRTDEPPKVLQRLTSIEKTKAALTCVQVHHVSTLPNYSLSPLSFVSPSLQPTNIEAYEYVLSYETVRQRRKHKDTDEIYEVTITRPRIILAVSQIINYGTALDISIASQYRLNFNRAFVPAILQNSSCIVHRANFTHRGVLKHAAEASVVDWQVSDSVLGDIPAVISQDALAKDKGYTPLIAEICDLLRTLFCIRPLWGNDKLLRMFTMGAKLRFRIPHSTDDATETDAVHTLVLTQYSRQSIQRALRYIGYQFMKGPWRKTWFQRGFDPRAHTRSGAIMQLIDYRISTHLVTTFTATQRNFSSPNDALALCKSRLRSEITENTIIQDVNGRLRNLVINCCDCALPEIRFIMAVILQANVCESQNAAQKPNSKAGGVITLLDYEKFGVTNQKFITDLHDIVYNTPNSGNSLCLDDILQTPAHRLHGYVSPAVCLLMRDYLKTAMASRLELALKTMQGEFVDDDISPLRTTSLVSDELRYALTEDGHCLYELVD